MTLLIETRAYFGVMNECTAFAVWRQLSSGGILETLDNGCLSRSIVSDNQSQGRIELDGLPDRRTKGPDPRDGEFVDSRHVERCNALIGRPKLKSGFWLRVGRDKMAC